MTLARGTVSAPGLTVLPAWRESLLAVVSRCHPAAERAVVDGADLADSVLRVPPRRHDPFMHDAVFITLREAGIDPRLGRPARSTIIEIGSGVDSWSRR